MDNYEEDQPIIQNHIDRTINICELIKEQFDVVYSIEFNRECNIIKIILDKTKDYTKIQQCKFITKPDGVYQYVGYTYQIDDDIKDKLNKINLISYFSNYYLI